MIPENYLSKVEPECNRRTLQEFNTFMDVNKYSEFSRYSYLSTIKKFCEGFNKPFNQTKEADIFSFIEKMKGSKTVKSEMTLENYKARIKRFYFWLELPECVKNLKIKKKMKIKTPDMMLDIKQIKQMVDVADNPRDRAMIITLAELGCRAMEFLNIQIKDLKFLNENLCEINLHREKDGVDGYVSVSDAVPYLKEWLNFHPDASNKKASLWVITSKYDPLKYGKQLSRIGFYYVIKSLSKRAKIEKNVFPHLFRHSRCSYLHRYLSDGTVKKLMGWKAGSRMLEQYSHISSKDANDELKAKVYGEKVMKDENVEKIDLTRTCHRCQTVNPIKNEFCLKCSSPLTKEAWENFEYMKDLIGKVLAEAWKQPNPKEALSGIVEKFKQSD